MLNFLNKSELKNDENENLRNDLIEAIKLVYDPEIPINVYDLGLIYGIDIDAEKNVKVAMTLTSPNCPEAQSLPVTVEQMCLQVEGVKSSVVEITWDPPWTKDQMSDEAKALLGIF